MAKYDLTIKMCQYMDLHLTFPVLEYLLDRDIYPREQIYQEIIRIVNKKTNLVDYTTDILCRLNVDQKIPEEFVQRKQQVLAKLSDLLQDAAPITKAISSDDNASTVRDSKTFLLELQKKPEYKPDWVDKAYNIAKYCYECGSYDLALSNLYFCAVVMQPTDKNYLNVLWGTLATDILVLHWASVLDDITRIREYIDNSNFSTIQALQQRTWLIHWTSFVLANHIKGREFIIDLYLYKPLYLNTIQTMCPHMLRYLAVALILSPGRRNALKDVIKIIQQESYTYRDPITEFLEHLYVNFDFEGARLKLHECQSVILNDFLIHSELLNFVENARLMMLETFCRIHQCITIGMLADKLNMDPNEVELWIVNLIRGAHLDAKIDSKLMHVVMGTQPLSPYQQLVEKIDSLSMRSEALTNLVERKLKSKNQDSGEGNWKYQK